MTKRYSTEQSIAMMTECPSLIMVRVNTFGVVGDKYRVRDHTLEFLVDQEEWQSSVVDKSFLGEFTVCFEELGEVTGMQAFYLLQQGIELCPKNIPILKFKVVDGKLLENGEYSDTGLNPLLETIFVAPQLETLYSWKEVLQKMVENRETVVRGQKSGVRYHLSHESRLREYCQGIGWEYSGESFETMSKEIYFVE